MCAQVQLFLSRRGSFSCEWMEINFFNRHEIWGIIFEVIDIFIFRLIIQVDPLFHFYSLSYFNPFWLSTNIFQIKTMIFTNEVLHWKRRRTKQNFELHMQSSYHPVSCVVALDVNTALITTKDDGRVRREGKCRKERLHAHAYVAKKGRWVWRGNTMTTALYNYFGKWRPGNVSWSGLCLTYKPITVVKNRKEKWFWNNFWSGSDC